MTRIYVGVAWPYANGPQHIGQLAGNALPADIFARYHRLAGDDVLMVSGSDMHGTPVTFRADEEGVPARDVAYRYHAVHEANFRALGISFDLYTHTENPWHQRKAQEIFLTLLKNGYLERRTEDCPYCPKHGRFLPDRYVTGTCPHCGFEGARGDECDNCNRVLSAEELKSPVCRLCRTPAEFRPSEHFFLLLPKLADRLREYHARQGANWRPSVRKFTENYMAGGLQPRPITRDITWGIPVPLDGYPSKRLYVWFEAVMGYLTASQDWALAQGAPARWKDFWAPDAPVKMYNFMGKDNITFHTIFWPAILLGVGDLHLPDYVPSNEHMLTGGHKMSKSRTASDWPIFLPDLLERFAPDVVRFYAAYHAPQNHDTTYDYDELVHDADQILADQWGNLVQRVLTFVRDRYGGKVPVAQGWEAAQDSQAAAVRAAHARVTAHLEQVELKEALERTLELVREINRQFHDAKPWAAAEPERSRILYSTVASVRSLAVMLAPVLPFSSARVAEMLGEPELLSPGGWGRALDAPRPGSALGPVSPIFPKLAAPARAASIPPSPATPASPPELDIRAALVREVKPHPGADKLYVLEVDVGETAPRTLVAGLRAFYRPEELSGRCVAMLANLAPRALRGVTSQGMLLAAEAGEVVSVLEAPRGTPAGTRLLGAPDPAPTIQYDDFARARLTTGRALPDGRLDLGGAPLEAPASKVPGEGSFIVRLDRSSPEVLTWASGGNLVPQRALPPGAKVR